MAELVLPAMQLSALAWDSIADALRGSADPLLARCAEHIGLRMSGLRENFNPMPGTVYFEVKAVVKDIP